MTLSLAEALDGSTDCGEDSSLGYWGLIVWTILVIYLFIGLYVLCEEYFVPILLSISKRLRMSEDVTGATLMAAGSSSPELFTAVIGVMFYANENPGPSTNCASAAFNMCVIIGCSIFFCGFNELPIRAYPFLRDCFFYALSVIELYLFWEVITPGWIHWEESLTLVTSWVIYILVLVYNKKSIGFFVRMMNWMGCNRAEEMLYEQLKQCEMSESSLSIIDNDEMSKKVQIQLTSDDFESGYTVPLKKDDLNITKNIIPNTKQHTFVSMEVIEADADDNALMLKNSNKTTQMLNLLRITKKPPSSSDASVGGVGILMSANDISDTGCDDSGVGMYHAHHGLDVVSRKGTVAKLKFLFHQCLKPFHWCFHYTIPLTNDDSKMWRLMLSFAICIIWLAFLTFICVDFAEKMGNCLGISADVLGLTLLAIGSSLPDCFSSVLAAKQGKGGMAVSNALGSNVFDCNICIGFAFLLKSASNGFKPIQVEQDTGFELFIAALFVLLAIFMVAMFCNSLILTKRVGYVLMVAYAIFLGAFCYLLQYD